MPAESDDRRISGVGALDPLRRLVPAPLKRALKRRLGLPETRLHPDWELLRRIGPVEEPHVILDVGAHTGWFFHCWRDWCPQAEVHAFEPTPESFERCRAGYGQEPRTHVVPMAVGSEVGTARLRLLSASRVSNSLLDPDREAWRSIAYEAGEVSTVEVPVTTLDIYCAEQAINRIHLLKIDVQGYELEVLRGAAATLPRVDHVFVESAIRRLYEGAPRFSEVFEHLADAGFDLIGLRAWHGGNQTLVESDLLFRRRALSPPVPTAGVRIYESS